MATMNEEQVTKTSWSFANNGDQGDSPAPTLLEPDHQLMERFQSALKQHLLRQRDQLDEEINELRITLKKTEKEENDVGIRLYNLKQELSMQQKAIMEKQSTLEETRKEREELSVQLVEERQKVSEIKRLCEEEIKREREKRLEMESLKAWEKQMTHWKEEMDSGLAINLRMSQKTEVDKRKLLEDKRQMDMYIFRLTSEISKLESELNLLDIELDRKEKERELLNQTVADANADLQAQLADQKRLLADWNAVIVCLAKRDSAYDQVLKELSASEEAFRDLNTQIESYKKSSDEEIQRNGELSLLMSRAKRDLENYSRQVKSLLDRKGDLERQLVISNDLAVQAERDLLAAEAQAKSTENELQNAQKEFDELTREKCRQEDESLTILLEQNINDKTAMHLNRQVKTLRENNRKQELSLADMENRTCKLFLEVEALKAATARNQDIIMEMNRDLDLKELELERVETDTKDIQSQIANKHGSVLLLNRKIEEMLIRKDVSLSPLDLKIRDLGWKIKDNKKENEILQQRWLQQQNQNVKLTQQRNDQLKEISMLRKQVVILAQKQNKIQQDLENERLIEMELERNANNMQTKLTTLCATLANQSEQRELVDRDLLLAQSAFVQSLRDSEHEQMKIKEEIGDLEIQLEELSDESLQTQREMLAWEKKIKLTIETKQAIQREKSCHGDIGQMKQEIHRMEVRYSQLKKVQEKLVLDLELSVRRREFIVDEARAKEKRKGNTRVTFQRKMDELRKKLKQARQELKSMDKVIAEAEAGQQELINQMNEKTEQLKKLEENAKEMEKQLENGYLRKQQNLEVLVRRQRKCKLYGLLKAGKYRPLHRNELALENELGIAKKTNSNLTAVLESLIADFPAHRLVFTKILNTLKPDPI